MALTENNILSIFQNKLSEKVISITDCSNGIEQIVKIVETAKKKYVIKYPLEGNESMIFNESFACRKLNGNIFVPKIIFEGNNYLIESFIGGQTLNKIKHLKETKKIYISLGKMIRKIHNIQMQGFGELQINGKGKHLKFADHIQFFLKEEIPLLKKTKLFNKKEIDSLLEYIKVNLNFINQNESVLLHCDLIDSNILVENSKISGIIDFGDAGCGLMSYDLAKIYIENDGNANFSNIMKGYGENIVNIKEIEYFSIFHLIYMIPYYYSINEKEKYTKLLKLLNKIVNI